MTVSTTSTSDAEALRMAMDRHALDADGAMPCVVQSVSEDGTSVDVVIAVQKAQSLDGNRRPLAPIVVKGVPVALYGSTSLGLFACPPISPGDDGIIFAMDRAIDNWQSGSGVRMPPDMKTPRHHDFTDGIFYPGAQRRSSAISSFPTDAFTIQDRSGGTVASVKPGEIKLTVGGVTVTVTESGVVVDGPLEVTQALSGGGGGTITGNLNVDGNVAATGTVTGSNIGA